MGKRGRPLAGAAAAAAARRENSGSAAAGAAAGGGAAGGAAGGGGAGAAGGAAAGVVLLVGVLLGVLLLLLVLLLVFLILLAPSLSVPRSSRHPQTCLGAHRDHRRSKSDAWRSWSPTKRRRAGRKKNRLRGHKLQLQQTKRRRIPCRSTHSSHARRRRIRQRDTAT
ncbi:hypothetical protein RI054_29g118150 [Pseudoscourfieldia marina]